MNYTPPDENNNGIPDGAEQEASGAKYGSHEESYTVEKEKGFFKRSIEKGRKILAGENTAGKIGGHVKDILTRFGLLPQWMNEATDEIGDSLKSKQTNKPMFSKILSVKNFINLKDQNGNFDPQELLYSVIQIAIAFGVVYGAVELGIWNELTEFMESDAS